jgi:hypothetical protein
MHTKFSFKKKTCSKHHVENGAVAGTNIQTGLTETECGDVAQPHRVRYQSLVTVIIFHFHYNQGNP